MSFFELLRFTLIIVLQFLGLVVFVVQFYYIVFP